MQYMNRHLSLRVLLLVTLLGQAFYSCKKGGDANPPGNPDPITTEKGVVNGTLTSKLIGAAGGDLASADGMLKLSVPAGAVSSNTEFSIQPITNTLFEGGKAKLAYRLLPEGTTFSKPITLEFSYTDSDLSGTLEELMTVAWQQPDGAWKLVPTRLNKATKTLTVETTHFSDWTTTGGFELRIDKEVLRTTEKAKLTVVTATGDDLLAHLTVSRDDQANLTALGKWKIIEGQGSLETKSGSRGFEYEAIYTAPATISGRKVVVITVEAEGFNGIKDPSVSGGIRRSGKIILFGRLIVSDNFLTGSLNGIPFGFFGEEVIATSFNGMIAIRAGDASGEILLSIHGNTAGSYPCGQFILPGKAGISLGVLGDQSFFYTHAYFECTQTAEQKYSSGSIVISKWPDVGGVAEGSFSGPVYLASDACGARGHSLQLQFSVTRGM